MENINVELKSINVTHLRQLNFEFPNCLGTLRLQNFGFTKSCILQALQCVHVGQHFGGPKLSNDFLAIFLYIQSAFRTLGQSL